MMSGVLRRFLPIVSWLPRYQRADLRPDLIAGVTVAALMIPQSMAYVHVAGFPAVVGLYCSVIPLFVYAIFGGSRTLAIGPVASISLITAAAIGDVATTPDELLELGAALALLSGVVALLLRIGRLGFVVSFLSDPVLTGFIGGVGVVILVTQFEAMTGLPPSESTAVIGDLPRLAREAGEITWDDLAFGVATIALMLGTRRWHLFPSALVAVLASMAIVWGFDLGADVDVVGAVPTGLAPPKVPTLDVDVVTTLAPAALAVTIIGFVETMALDRTETGPASSPRLDANDELVAYGATNVSAGLFQGIPVLGVPTRTAVAVRAGARTQLTGVVAGVTALVVLLTATDLFRYLPTAVLGGVVSVAAISFFKVAKARRIWSTKRADFWLGMATFVTTPTLGLEWGLAVGAMLSLVLVVYRAAHPHLTVLGRQPGTDAFRALERDGTLETHDGVVLVRIDAPIFYANADLVADHLRGLVASCASGPAPVRALVADFSGVDDVDSTAATALDRLVRSLHASDVAVYLVNVHEDVRDVLDASGVTEALGTDRYLATDYDAIVALEHPDLAAGRSGAPPVPAAEEVDGERG